MATIIFDTLFRIIHSGPEFPVEGDHHRRFEAMGAGYDAQETPGWFRRGSKACDRSLGNTSTALRILPTSLLRNCGFRLRESTAAPRVVILNRRIDCGFYDGVSVIL